MITIIDSGGANISSILFGVERLGKKAWLTADIKKISEADYVILPGVGTANDSMQRLKNAGLIDCIKNLKQPVLGICLGMQLLFDYSEEGQTQMLGIIEGNVTLMRPQGLTIPHMGWNNLKLIKKDSPVAKGIKDNDYFYFVHSYMAALSDNVTAYTEYGEKVAAIVNKNNFYGTQFHPERSAEAGAVLLKNFLELK
ncbi:MAG: imidazole glycerol phosphate synthase subunit HisH [Oligoflexia bacterium]|nr:imidazole glycerol phosphate synthase subunit HisH [Oligoflexia bacterium]